MNPPASASDEALALWEQARACRQRGQLAEAANAFSAAQRIAPNHPGILADFGQFAEDMQDWQAAAQIYRHFRNIGGPPDLDAKLGQVLFQSGNYAEAIPLLDAYAGRNPGNGIVLRMLGTACFRLQRFAEALQYAQRAWNLDRQADALALQLAVLIETGEPQPTDHLVDEGLRLFPQDPQIRRLAAEHLLKTGDVARGLPSLRDLRVPPNAPPHYFDELALPEWQGEIFAGTLLVGAEQGLGDEILVSSVFADLARSAQPAIIECDARLLPLFRRAFPTLEFIDRGGKPGRQLASRLPAARKIIAGDLPALFRRRAADFPPHAAWLQADAARRDDIRARYAARWPGQRLIGLSWRSQRVMRKSGARKDIDLAALLPLLQSPGCVFVNLQYGDTGDEVAALGETAGRLYRDPAIDAFHDIDGLAAQIAALDLVITTSNVTAHIAGALGVPCWLLLPRRRPVIWYWGYAGDSSSWYPSLRLWRNPRENGWDELVARLRQELQALPRFG